MQWSSEAEAAIRKVPFLVRKKVRQRVENEAAAAGKPNVSLADVQDPELLNKGRDSFVESIRHCGLGVLFGVNMGSDMAISKKLYYTETDEQAKRTIDADREMRRRQFEKLREQMSTLPSQIQADRVDYVVLDVFFNPGRAMLTDQARQVLSRFALRYSNTRTDTNQGIYIMGLPDSTGTDQEKWILSAQRAQAAAQYLKKTIEQRTNEPAQIFSWGRGPSRGWAGDAVDPGAGHLLVAVLKAG